MIKKSKSQKIHPEEQAQKVQKTKKSKNKKKKRQAAPDSKKQTNENGKQNSGNSKQQKPQVTPIKQQKDELSKKQQEERLQRQALINQYNQLQIQGTLQVNQQRCIKVNQLLEQLTINLLSNMVMKQSLITEALKHAKLSKMTPNQYFYLDYTNKILLIRKLLETSPKKYEKYIKLIDRQYRRVEGLILLGLSDVKIYDEVYEDLKRNNKELALNPLYFQGLQTKPNS